MCLLGQICSFPGIDSTTQNKQKCRKKEILNTINKYTGFLRSIRFVFDTQLQLGELKFPSKKSDSFFLYFS